MPTFKHINNNVDCGDFVADDLAEATAMLEGLSGYVIEVPESEVDQSRVGRAWEGDATSRRPA